jgi:hypothetical protein
MANPFQLDATPLDSDWDDIHAMFKDIRNFMKEHPDHELISADDPGQHYTPWRIPRMGWQAFLRGPVPAPEGFDEQAKSWTLPLFRLKGIIDQEGDKTLVLALKSAAGRQSLCQQLAGREP